jgi:PAS domain S-box-containing protein
MREYMRRLLSDRFEVAAVGDGRQAIEAAVARPPDLILTDVMMPNLDGFGLLRALRADPRTATIPVIMLSARAGEEARVEGLGAGADDYLIKPFSSRELIARVGGTLALSRFRRDALRREEELRAETANVLESITEGFVALDRDFRFTYINAEAERMNGVRRSVLIGKTLWEAFPAALGADLAREYRRAMETRVALKLEHRYRPWDKWYGIDAYPSKDGGIAIYFRDITERKRRTEQLQQVAAAAVAVNGALAIEDILQTVVDRAREIIGAREGVAAVKGDGALGPLTVARSALDESTRRNATLDADVDSELPSESRPPHPERLATPLVGRDGRRIGVLRLAHKLGGGEFSAADQAILVQVAQTASVALANAQLYRTAEDARADAEAANRMKDQFLATLSHELRTPLNAILGWARILRGGQLGSTALAEGLETIERNSKVQAQLIEDLLDLSRIISGKLRLDVQSVNLVDVIEAAIAAVRPAADAKEIRIRSVLDSLASAVNGDPARIQQVVWNLLSNAVKFTPRGGQVQVLLERVNSHVEISVSDTGIGIKPDFLPYVFDRFRQADASTTRKHGGLGLGLSIVRQLVEMHGGTVRAKSAGEGKGATFSIALPVALARPDAQRKPERVRDAHDAPLDRADLGGLRVLVVDDEADARELVRRILTGAHASVKIAASVEEALDAIRGDRPDVLLSDIGMPERDGFDLIRVVRQEGIDGRQMPAVALTAFARPEDRRRALLAGFQMHVAKPVDPDELVAVVATLVGRTGPGGP